MPDWNQISDKLKSETGNELVVSSARRVLGGDISESYCLLGVDGTLFFIKTNAAQSAHAMFLAEAQALCEVASSKVIRVPKVLCLGQTEYESYLVLEYLELSSNRDDALLGRQLAAMHACTQPEYGWRIDNNIGSTIQLNAANSNWCDFWLENRLVPQLSAAKANGCDLALLTLGDQLVQISPTFLADHKPKASMLHGDLWAGNAAGLQDGTPVIFDPAIYYGDREADLAMMELFGGFTDKCFAAYNESSPIDQQGYALRKDFYNLYHLLNHYNLFGGTYQRGCVDVMQKLLAVI